MQDIKSHFPKLLLFALGTLICLWVYIFTLDAAGLIPLAGKKAPNYVIILIAQYLLAKNWVGPNRASKVHFLKLFLYLYIFVFIVSLLSAFSLYYFYLSPSGIAIMTDYIQVSVNQVGQFKEQIIQQEGVQYYKDFMQSIQGISAYSIGHDEFMQKIVLAFLPNLLISLYFKQ